jgi:hypothetical protein
MERPPLQAIRVPVGWVVDFNDLFQVEASSESYERGFLKEDLLQLRHIETNAFIDVGWYGAGPPEGQFGIHVHEKDFTGLLLEEHQTASRPAMIAMLEELLLKYGKELAKQPREPTQESEALCPNAGSGAAHR